MNEKQNNRKKTKQLKERTKAKNNPTDLDDDKIHLFDADSELDSLIKCLMCSLWTHNDCVSSQFNSWICDFYN